MWLEIRLNFTQPEMVSAGTTWDPIRLRVDPGDSMFYDQELMQMEPFEMMITLPPQSSDPITIATTKKAGAAMKNVMNSVGVLNFIIVLIISSSMEHFWSLANVM